MYKGDKYITRGIQVQVGLDIQIVLWGMIEELNQRKEIEMDYLQLFRLKPKDIEGTMAQEIEHSQEVPPYKNTVLLKIDNVIEATIFVIEEAHENGQVYRTMMLSSEY